AQLPIDLLAHLAVGGERHLHTLAVPRSNCDRVARYGANRPGQSAALAAETAALPTAVACALPTTLAPPLIADPLREIGPVLLAGAPANRLPTIESKPRYQQQRDDLDNSFP